MSVKRVQMASKFKADAEMKMGFGEVSFEILSDFLTVLNTQNKSNLQNLSGFCGNFKVKRVVEHVFCICEELELDPLVGYHAIEILDRFMVKHIENLFSVQRNASSEGDSYRAKENHEHRILQRLGENFPVFLFSCVQIASKLASYSSALDNRSVSGLLHSLGISCPKQKLLKSELLILKTLDFQLSVPNPLLYVETLLEVLGHNDPSIRVPQLHRVCRCVLQFIFLQREKIYQSLLEAATGSHSPSSEQRAKFASVTEDCMLLGVGVIAVSAFFSHRAAWKEVAKELALITGISVRSIINFAQMTLAHIT